MLKKLHLPYSKNNYLSIFNCNLENKTKKMTVIIDKNNSKNAAKILSEKLKKKRKKGNLVKHFGKLKRNIDGLDYQNSVRENED